MQWSMKSLWFNSKPVNNVQIVTKLLGVSKSLIKIKIRSHGTFFVISLTSAVT